MTPSPLTYSMPTVLLVICVQSIGDLRDVDTGSMNRRMGMPLQGRNAQEKKQVKR